ncbi:hypothetical protein Tco_1264814 [Tanacetum coccineum]
MGAVPTVPNISGGRQAYKGPPSFELIFVEVKRMRERVIRDGREEDMKIFRRSERFRREDVIEMEKNDVHILKNFGKGMVLKNKDSKKYVLDDDDTVMSDSDESGITYTTVSSPYEDLSDLGSPRADDHEFVELPYMPEDPYVEAALQAPPSPDYVPGLEEPKQAPLLPDYVPGPEHADDKIVAEDQSYADEASPTAQSPDYVPETDPEADPEEDDDEDPEEDPIDYPADGGDDEMAIEEDEDDDMDIDADDEDDEIDIEVDEEAKEEHSAPAYPVVVALPATVPITCTMPWSDYEVDRRLDISSPQHHHYLHGLSSPPQDSFPISPPSPILRLTLPPRKRLGIALGPGYEVGESSAAAAARPAGDLRADYGFIDTMDKEIRHDLERYVGYGIMDSWG